MAKRYPIHDAICPQCGTRRKVFRAKWADTLCRPCSSRANLKLADPPKRQPRWQEGEPVVIIASDVSRFWARVEVAGPEECWLWTGRTAGPGYREGRGYGKIYVCGKERMAHRISFSIATGASVDGEHHVLHRCDNPKCVNPAHLFAGSHADNMRDMVAKSRNNMARIECRQKLSALRRGEGSTAAKLTAVDIDAIVQMRMAGIKLRDIATKFGVARSTISKIFLGERWTVEFQAACRCHAWPLPTTQA